ncbi:MAG: hypothetical protein JST53_11535 [Actinobacteria bacterium]|nr:hypothetical protein [Actinomycetota bacterium]
MPRRLRPTADIYEDAILVGDPGRAMALAQVVIEGPKMCNHARGLWGYSGMTGGGCGLTVQATGMGGPSAAVVLGDLADLAVRRAVRIGTGAALAPDLRPGNLVVASEARAWRGDGRAGPPTVPDEALTARLLAALGDEARVGRVASLDVIHPTPGHPTPEGHVADMQTAALLAAARHLGVALAAVLVVTEAAGFDELEDEAMAERAILASQAALKAMV